jgi:hypothetical protein
MVDLGGKDQIVVRVGQIPDHHTVDGGGDDPGIRIKPVDVSQRGILGHLVQGFEDLAETDIAGHLPVAGKKTPRQHPVRGEREHKQVSRIVRRYDRIVLFVFAHRHSFACFQDNASETSRYPSYYPIVEYNRLSGNYLMNLSGDFSAAKKNAGL